jgi:RNA polymerase subunit RPABC4/transcription elongation factor Spt4
MMGGETRCSEFFPASQLRALVRARRGICGHHGVEGRRWRGAVITFEKSYCEHARERGRVKPGRYADVPPRVAISGQQYHAPRGVLAQYSRHNCIAGQLGSRHGG